MTREEAIHFATCLKNNWTINFDDMEEFCDIAIKALNSVTDSEDDTVNTENDVIKRQDALMEAKPEYLNPSQQGHESYNQGWNGAISAYYTGIKMLPSATETVDCSGFIKWILDEIMDEENWELNAVANGEIIARKLKKLGLLEVKDGYYVRTPLAEAKGDLISRQWLLELYGDYIGDDGESKYHVPLEVVRQNIKDAPSADTDMSEYCDRLWKIAYERGKAEAEQHNKDAISREGLLKSWEELSPRGRLEFDQVIMTIPALPSVEAVPIHNDGTLEVKVPNAQKVGRVLVMDTDSHIGGGLFYPAEAVQGWIPVPTPYKGGDDE